MMRFDPRKCYQSLYGKVAVITGAAQGIGRETALKFAHKGATVVICDIDSQTVSSVAYECAQLGLRALGCAVDVTCRESLDAMAEKVFNEFGSIDILVNNAGITRDARFQNMSEEQFDQVVDVNLRGVFNSSQSVLKYMLYAQSGVILNASSVVGIYGNFGQTNYAATKFGVIGFTKTWSRELGPKGIRVNAVAPGFIETPMTQSVPEQVLEKMRSQVPLGRLGTSEEIANVYAFLASDEASYINGAVIEVSGGLSL